MLNLGIKKHESSLSQKQEINEISMTVLAVCPR